jgi:hypothetical protein
MQVVQEQGQSPQVYALRVLRAYSARAHQELRQRDQLQNKLCGSSGKNVVFTKVPAEARPTTRVYKPLKG